MAKVENKSFCIQRCFFEEFPGPLLNGMEGKGRVGFYATGMAKEGLAKAVHTPKPAPVGVTLSTRGVIRKTLLVEIFMYKGIPQGNPVR